MENEIIEAGELSAFLPEYIIQHALNEPGDSNSDELWYGFRSATLASPISLKAQNSSISPQVAPLESRIHCYINKSRRLLDMDAKPIKKKSKL